MACWKFFSIHGGFEIEAVNSQLLSLDRKNEIDWSHLVVFFFTSFSYFWNQPTKCTCVQRLKKVWQEIVNVPPSFSDRETFDTWNKECWLSLVIWSSMVWENGIVTFVMPSDARSHWSVVIVRKIRCFSYHWYIPSGNQILNRKDTGSRSANFRLMDI